MLFLCCKGCWVGGRIGGTRSTAARVLILNQVSCRVILLVMVLLIRVVRSFRRCSIQHTGLGPIPLGFRQGPFPVDF
ncbi:hypothetical protein B0O80DRAFT_464381 [Mortierella sp. GBAus27b]|nr:hypothetical protein B0O80DRAFT_464381 [Mortierella sp. GBAus27b]